MGKRLDRLNELIHSPKGKNAMIFMAFLLLSSVMWIIQALNEDVQRDIRCSVRLVNVPDSLVRVTPLPEAINVSVRAKGTQMVKYLWDHDPVINIDYRTYRSGNKIQFSEASMRALFRNMLGANAQLQSITPDSLSILFTSHRGTMMPVHVEASINVAPQHVLVKKPYAICDTVQLYSAHGVPTSMKYISTQPLNVNNLKKSQVFMVPLLVPPGMRAIPDSIGVAVEIEPLISKTRKVTVTPVNVPSNLKLITMPAQVEIYYMVPMSIYKSVESDPQFRVEVDFNSIRDYNSEKAPLRLAYAPKNFTNVFLSTDSIDFILEEQ